jgi:hypothetical protein
MDEAELISNWSEQKRASNYCCLAEASDFEFEFRGRLGHPSQYALVKFVAKPADRLSLTFDVQWREEFDEVYTLRIKHSIAEAVLDVLFSWPPGREMGPYRGCELTLSKFGWHEVSGSEVAVRRQR